MQKYIPWVGAGVAVLVVGGVAAYLGMRSAPPLLEPLTQQGAPAAPAQHAPVAGAPETPLPTVPEPDLGAVDLAAITATALQGFDRCDQSNELHTLASALMKRAQPVEKHEAGWTFAIGGSYQGLPIHRIEVGVCNLAGERDCGWGNYLGLLLDAPLDAARQKLLEKTGIDYTQEQRDESEEQTQVTLRPFLGNHKLPAQWSRLSCDPGGL